MERYLEVAQQIVDRVIVTEPIDTMLMFGSSLKDGNRHETEDLPLVLAGRGGGTIRTGRRLTAPERTPLCNLYVAMMQRMGVDAEQFGTSDGVLELS